MIISFFYYNSVLTKIFSGDIIFKKWYVNENHTSFRIFSNKLCLILSTTLPLQTNPQQKHCPLYDIFKQVIIHFKYIIDFALVAKCSRCRIFLPMARQARQIMLPICDRSIGIELKFHLMGSMVKHTKHVAH